MWRNADVLDFVGWLRAHNDAHRTSSEPAGFYGLDLYSLSASIAEVLAYLERIDPAGAERARERYACFEPFGGEQAYGRAVASGSASPARAKSSPSSSSCSDSRDAYLRRDGIAAEDEQFYAEQNARLVANAEEYYRAMFGGRGVLLEPARPPHGRHARRARRHLDRHGGRRESSSGSTTRTSATPARPRWARRGELNVGQLARERYGPTTSPSSASPPTRARSRRPRTGTRRPSASGCGPRCPRATRPSSTRSACPRFSLDLLSGEAARALRRAAPRARDRRHLPARDRARRATTSTPTWPSQFDAVVHIDETRAVEPLERTAGWEAGEPPETYPSGL